MLGENYRICPERKVIILANKTRNALLGAAWRIFKKIPKRMVCCCFGDLDHKMLILLVRNTEETNYDDNYQRFTVALVTSTYTGMLLQIGRLFQKD